MHKDTQVLRLSYILIHEGYPLPQASNDLSCQESKLLPVLFGQSDQTLPLFTISTYSPAELCDHLSV